MSLSSARVSERPSSGGSNSRSIAGQVILYVSFVRVKDDVAEVCFAFEFFFDLGSAFDFDSRWGPFDLVFDSGVARFLFVERSSFDSGSFLPAFDFIPRMKDGSEPSTSLASLPFGVMWKPTGGAPGGGRPCSMLFAHLLARCVDLAVCWAFQQWESFSHSITRLPGLWRQPCHHWPCLTVFVSCSSHFSKVPCWLCTVF